MFRGLFTTTFRDVRSPRVSIPQDSVDESAEDFAHDVRVEIIRRTVEDLKIAPNIAAQIKVGTHVTCESLFVTLTASRSSIRSTSFSGKMPQ